ncbi:MAG: thermonuclease family protein [Pseudomonadota bacterium]
MRLAIWRTVFVVAIALALSGCGGPRPLEDFQPGERGRVVRVSDGDALVLDTGQSVRLVGIEAPGFGRDGREDSAYAREAHRVLEDLVLGREVQLHYAGLTRDRYDRALAHVTTVDRLGPAYWINLELIERGAVRVRSYPDTARGSDQLYEVEEEARLAGQGLWALADYRVEDARDFDTSTTGLVILTAILGPREPAPFDDTACARHLLGSAITVTVERPAMDACDLEAGLRVQVRGWHRDGRLRLNAAQNLRPLAPAAIAARPGD